MPAVQISGLRAAGARRRGGLTRDARRERILDGAMRCFAKLGYRKTSLDDVSRECGLVKTALYHYFDSKQALFAAVVRREATRIEAALDKADDREDEPIVRLQSVLFLRFELARDMIFLHRLGADVLDEMASSATAVREEFHRREEQRLERILRDGVRRKSFGAVSPKLGARAMVAALRGVELEILREPLATDARRLVEEIVHALLFGLVAERRGRPDGRRDRRTGAPHAANPPRRRA